MKRDSNSQPEFDYQMHKLKHLKEEFNFLMDLISVQFFVLVIYYNLAPNQSHMTIYFKTLRNLIIAFSV